MVRRGSEVSTGAAHRSKRATRLEDVAAPEDAIDGRQPEVEAPNDERRSIAHDGLRGRRVVRAGRVHAQGTRIAYCPKVDRSGL
jgi:hypothetical protein